jgi:hypothetical protein
MIIVGLVTWTDKITEMVDMGILDCYMDVITRKNKLIFQLNCDIK